MNLCPVALWALKARGSGSRPQRIEERENTGASRTAGPAAVLLSRMNEHRNTPPPSALWLGHPEVRRMCQTLLRAT
ncbi:hypothetical protein F7725_014992 [Dissostichus mawsoni]|uniref:Uncharacterized protein n=1 Tax=Dissostichus mawsoni TaxID=36200 RepID=A0A7J5YGE8_DISMA|nr:hypothetical protein F7725_014992 [Dissostichus mawsoni]